MNKITYILLALVIGLSLWIGYLLSKPAPTVKPVYITDTVLVKGDTVVKWLKFEQKGTATAFPKPGYTKVPIDTIIFDQRAIIAILSEDVRDSLGIYYYFECIETVKTIIDTIKIKEYTPYEVKVEKPEPWYDEFEYGYLAGTIVTLGILYLVKDK